MTVAEAPDKNGRVAAPELDPATHRRILTFLNDAVVPDDLVHRRPRVLPEGDHIHEDNPEILEREQEKVLDPEIARAIIDYRDEAFPLGFRHLKELELLEPFKRGHLEALLRYFGYLFYGRWEFFQQQIPRRGPGGYDGVVHAALLHTGQVLFITADETTLLWDPTDATPATFEDPVNQPHQIPDTTSGYSVLCGGHAFLSDGRLLVAGGGGYGPHHLARWGYKFDPVGKSWSRTAGSMVHDRWYPTVLTLGDQRIGNSHELLVVCGHGAGDMEIYDEATDSFREVTGDTKPFPSLYPGLHLLPNHTVFYSGTGWASAGPGGGPYTGDDQSSFFSFTGPDNGVWNDIAPVSMAKPDRTKGMSVMLLNSSPPYVRVLVVGGADPSTNNTYELVDATSLSSATNWSAPVPFPDGEHRSLASAVLLPDGTVFMAGGIGSTNSPSAIFNPQTNSWSPAASLPSIRDYHSVALLLPSGQVMMAGWNNTSIEIFNPPYLFRGPRPVIAHAPSLVHHGQTFNIQVPHGGSIDKVVMVRPMAVTHQTDTQQRVLELPVTHHGQGANLTLTAPHGGHPHSLAQQGYYMLFAISDNGVPSEGTWIYLH
jgi:hypothetical protein